MTETLLRALLAFSLPFLAACSGGKPAEPVAPREELAAAAKEAGALSDRLFRLVQHPWKIHLPSLGPITSYQSQLVGFASVASAPAVSDDAARKLAAEGRRLLSGFDDRLRVCVEMVESIVPAADKAHNLRMQGVQQLALLQVPAETPCPLRQRFEDGWWRGVTEALGLLDQGLCDYQAKGDQTRAKIGAANLVRAGTEGVALFTEIGLLVRDVQVLSGKIERLQNLNAWSVGVIKKAEEARAAGGPKAPDAARIDEARAAQTAVEAALPGLQAKTAAARDALIRGLDGARARFDEAVGEIDAVRVGFLQVFLGLARDLGLPDPK